MSNDSHWDWLCGSTCSGGRPCTQPVIWGACRGPEHDPTPVDPFAEPHCPCLECQDARAGGWPYAADGAPRETAP